MYLVFLVTTLPASLLLKPLAKNGIQSGGASGSIWHGQMTALQVGVLNLGTVDWNLRLLPLFTGKLAADVSLKQGTGFAQARVAVGFSGLISFSDVAASLPLQSLVGNDGLPGGWVGQAQVKLAELQMKDGWPVKAEGTLDVIDLTGPARQPSNIGAYRLQFPVSGEPDADALVGTLQSLDGAAIDVVGTLKFAADRSYQLDTLVAARANASADLAQSMQYLGNPDAQGRRPFSLSGTF